MGGNNEFWLAAALGTVFVGDVAHYDWLIDPTVGAIINN